MRNLTIPLLLVAVSLPGNNKVGGFWPGVWTFGNLGRAGYTGTTDGVSSGSHRAPMGKSIDPDKLCSCFYQTWPCVSSTRWNFVQSTEITSI